MYGAYIELVSTFGFGVAEAVKKASLLHFLVGDLGGSGCVVSIFWEGVVFLGGVIGTLAFLLVLRYELLFGPVLMKLGYGGKISRTNIF